MNVRFGIGRKPFAAMISQHDLWAIRDGAESGELAERHFRYATFLAIAHLCPKMEKEQANGGENFTRVSCRRR